jgi:hypothetical protein
MGSVSFMHLFHFDRVSATLVLALVGAFSFAYLIFNAVRSYQRLKHIPGPRLAAWTELWLFKAALCGNFQLNTEQLFRRYGLSTLVVVQDLDI